jgi:Glycosyltransferase family 87
VDHRELERHRPPLRWVAGTRPALALAAILAPIALLLWDIAHGGYGLWNDFASYWLAGKLVAAGHSPYDLTALARLGHREGIVFQAGTGYSYPLPFAVAMVPLSELPFQVAAVTFTAVSLLVFGLAVSGWLRDPWVFRAGPLPTILAAFLAGCYPPVLGSAFFGQANLLVFGALALGIRAWARSGTTSSLVGGAWIGLGGIVKVAPLALVVPALVARRVAGALGVIGGACAALLLAVLLAPFGAAGMGGLGGLLMPDPYWTNQSLNGFVSRLTMRTERTTPLLPHLDPALVGGLLLGTLAIATLAVLLLGRRSCARWDGYALGIGLTLVAASAGAPKNSFWNQVPALLGVGLLLTSTVVGRRLDRVTRTLLVAWFGLALVQRWVDSLADATLRGMGPAGALLSSAAFYSLIMLWVAIGREVLGGGRDQFGRGYASGEAVTT